MNPIHTKKDLRSFSQGSDFDSSSEFLGASDQSLAIDMHNMRYADDNKDAPVKIGGEALLYDAVNNACFFTSPYAALSSTYECIGARDFFLEDDASDHHIEFWAATDFDYFSNTNPPFIRIDGIVVAMSRDFPITYNHPLQLDINPNCTGGEIYITDYNVIPMIFNLRDLMENGGFTFGGITECTQKYFSAFDIDEYSLELINDNNHPIFIGLVPLTSPPVGAQVIGTGGNDVGMYQYQVRKVTASGDRTGWSKATPLIPLAIAYDKRSSTYPYNNTYGGPVANTSPLGIWIRIRVDNTAGYDFLEFKRTRYTAGSPPGSPGIEKLLDFRLDLDAGDFFVKDIFDVGALELDLDETNALSTFTSVRRAKTIRYYDSKVVLMNVEFNSRLLSGITFLEIADKKMFPVVQKMTTPTRLDGHKGPRNYAYYRSLMRGERYGWALLGRDANNQVSFALPVPDSTLGVNYQDFQMPNRREAVSTETQVYSNATVKAAHVDGNNSGVPVTQTHEVFDTVDAINKPDSTPIINIQTVSGNYQPVTPRYQGDLDTSGHYFNINSNVNQSTGDVSSLVSYNPRAFGLNYYALGMGLAGVQNIPSYIKSLSLVRTKPARRIFAQGLAYYKINNPSTFVNNKETSQFVFYSPDLDPATGIDTIQTVIDSVNAGEGRFKIQAVSPLGFFTELWSGYTEDTPGNWATDKIDLINYARILRENGSINPGDTPSNNSTSTGVGFDAATTLDGYGYTGYAKWRRRTIPSGSSRFPQGGSGNQLFDISAISVVVGSGTVSERVQQFQISTVQNLFDFSALPAAGTAAFTNADTQNWHEPMYVVNIVDTFATVPQPTIQNYIETESYQKIEATVGIIQGGLSLESFLIVDERDEDYRDVIFTSDGKVYANVTGVAAGPLGVIVNSIVLGVYQVIFSGVSYVINGVFTVSTSQLTPEYNEKKIVFDTSLNTYAAPNSVFMPDATVRVQVRYNASIPMKSFGGETTIHESVFSPLDLSWTFGSGVGALGATPNYLNFSFVAPFPYIGFDTNINYNQAKYLVATIPNIPIETIHEVNLYAHLSSGAGANVAAKVRQFLCMFTCESRVSLPMEYELNPAGQLSFDKYFPATNYIMRPFSGVVDPATDATQNPNGPWPQYFIDYPLEYTYWQYGGWRFRPNFNVDYSAQAETQGAVSAPSVGFNEETLFCNAIIWSLTRPDNVVSAPGLRTFPATNIYIITDDTGDIKYAYDDFTEARASNLYAITESGIFLLVTNKTILSTQTGEQLAAIGASGGSNFITAYYPISKSIGMNDEFWRSAAEGYNVIQGDLTSRRVEALFFQNKNSSYRFSGGMVFDLARGSKYHSRLAPYLNAVQSGYSTKMASVYDLLHDEYWACMQVGTKPTVLFAEKKSHYIGTSDYSFDKFTSFKNKTFGMRQAKTYLLNQYGENINGVPITSELVGVSAKELPSSKNFSRTRISTINNLIKPDKVLFYNTKANYLTNTDRAEIDTIAVPLSLKNYGAFEGYIPRKLAGNRDHIQGRECVFVIKQTGNNSFGIVDVEIGYTNLK